jgi:hypothetical protein
MALPLVLLRTLAAPSPPSHPVPLGAGCLCTSEATTCMSGGVDVARACGCQDSGDGNPWCFVVDPSTCAEAEQVRSTWVALVVTPPPATAPKRTALAGAAPIHLVLLLRREALRPVQRAPEPTSATCHVPTTTKPPASTVATVFAARATVNTAAAVACPRRPPAPTGPTVGSLGATPAARRPVALYARHGVLAHADRH